MTVNSPLRGVPTYKLLYASAANEIIDFHLFLLFRIVLTNATPTFVFPDNFSRSSLRAREITDKIKPTSTVVVY